MTVKVVKNGRFEQSQVMQQCADGCCSWPEWEAGDDFSEGEEFDVVSRFKGVVEMFDDNMNMHQVSQEDFDNKFEEVKE